MPVVVVTHDVREKLTREGGTTFTFVNDGIESALQQVKAAAGGKGVSVAGGANIISQYVKAGLLDEIQIHLVPILLAKVPYCSTILASQIELERKRVILSPGVTHLKFRVVK